MSDPTKGGDPGDVGADKHTGSNYRPKYAPR